MMPHPLDLALQTDLLPKRFPALPDAGAPESILIPVAISQFRVYVTNIGQSPDLIPDPGGFHGVFLLRKEPALIPDPSKF